jgi:hypothetical protein
MKKFLGFVVLLALMALARLGFDKSKALCAQQAGATTPYAFTVTGTAANCPAVAASTTQYCFTTTGLLQSLNGAAWVPLGGAPPITSITYNGAAVPVTSGVAAISGPTTATVTGTLTGAVK